jgi:hypothetical protein
MLASAFGKARLRNPRKRTPRERRNRKRYLRRKRRNSKSELSRIKKGKRRKRRDLYLAMKKSPFFRHPFSMTNLLYRRGQLQRLLRPPHRREKVAETLQRVEAPFHLREEDGVAVVVEGPQGPRSAKKCLARNERFIGLSRHRVHYNELKFLAMVITANGVSPSLARMMNFLFGYLRDSKPHGFSRHITQVVKAAWLLT